ncbi:MAG: class I tRNA ligase family protein, partial [Oscillospiraceae bacterium]|nr:class I tRNA ligase family protein [Oscillospiraceae bacterium]
MPYGNKSLHFGHIGGVFVFADVYARFLRDRIGKENVVFVSGTDCYGSPIAESYRAASETGAFSGTVEDFVRKNHETQKAVLDAYGISLDLFGASALGRTGEIHKEMTEYIIRKLYENGHLIQNSTAQFYDEKAGTFLNGRQVIGKCPVQGCASEKGYADECDLGHQYMPENLINPKSTLTGETPVMKDVVNWYFKLTEKLPLLREYVQILKESPNVRSVVYKTVAEFLEPPVIYVMNDYMDSYLSVKDEMGEHTLINEPKKTSFTLKFENLEDCDKASRLLSGKGARFRTGKTLVPFRLTGNIEWGVPAPDLNGEGNSEQSVNADIRRNSENAQQAAVKSTVWVWPESLWAPISFTKAYLGGGEDWRNFWQSRESKVYQFIGQDNIYFYGIAQQAMFMALQGKDNLTCDPAEGQMTLSTLVANYHVLFLDKKASSSGNIKPPMADELLDYYTPEQLRAHFLGLGLGSHSVSFQPKPFNPLAEPQDSDPVVKEGSLLTNVFNRIIRTAFYDVQKYFDGVMPVGTVSEDILKDSEKAVL